MSQKDKTLARLELEMALKSLIDNLDIILEQQRHFAKALRNYFTELQRAGFDKTEALEIVKAHGLFPPMGNS